MGLHELKVDLEVSEKPPEEEPRFRYALSPHSANLPFAALQSSLTSSKLDVGSRVEFSPLSYATASSMAQMVGKSTGGGSALIVDYGKETIAGDTFRVGHYRGVYSQQLTLIW
jgi:NADH dehydrogenase [ubiquinone] 1 alpha subcomplex assembly factor 7